MVESGENLTDKQKQYHKKNVMRDVAILTLFLTTGIRVSELVSLKMCIRDSLEGRDDFADKVDGC